MGCMHCHLDFNKNTPQEDIMKISLIFFAFAVQSSLACLGMWRMLEVRETNNEEEINRVFNFYDEDSDGFISLPEFNNALMVNYGYTMEEAEKAFRKFDGNGMINYQEFSTMMKGNTEETDRK